ncbi:MAG: PIN domain-containing protein [Actinomycetota bacterium]|nr:PIN domain-containing protein [Actinomycetota bacterium]
MSLAVVDASVLAVFYASDDRRRDAVVERLSGSYALVAAAHLDVEVVSALRGLASRHPTLRDVMPHALRHLAGFSIRRLPLAPLLERMWELRDNVTPYDAAYIAIAERLDAPLVTCDGKLAGSSGPRCAFELIT